MKTLILAIGFMYLVQRANAFVLPAPPVDTNNVALLMLHHSITAANSQAAVLNGRVDELEHQIDKLIKAVFWSTLIATFAFTWLLLSYKQLRSEIDNMSATEPETSATVNTARVGMYAPPGYPPLHPPLR